MSRYRYRVVSDNDYGGDPDGLVQLAHLLLSPTLDIRAVVVSHFRQLGTDTPSRTTADDAVPLVHELSRVAGRADVHVAVGANHGLTDEESPLDTPGARAIVEEAMRGDTDEPLFVLAGGSLTSVASAYLLEPRIAGRMTLVWIGGNDHDPLSPRWTAPRGPGGEYNHSLDPAAVRAVFNRSSIPIWQVPQGAYRQTLVSWEWLTQRLRSGGALGAWLQDRLDRERQVFDRIGLTPSETFVLGDSPLVLLTALQTVWEPDTATSAYDVVETPTLLPDGSYRPHPGGRPMRLYRGIDTRLMLDDFVAKLVRHEHESAS